MIKLKLEEGELFNQWLDRRFNSNKNALVAVIGPTGSGKTYTTLRMAQLWYLYKFNKPLPLDNICFTLSDLAKRLNRGMKTGDLAKGDILILEEAGIALGSLEFQNKISKLTGYVLQSFRSKNIAIIFTLPSIHFLNKTARVLLHMLVEMKGIDKYTKETKCRMFRLQYNSRYDKTYNPRLQAHDGHSRMPVSLVRYKLPSEEIRVPYEVQKDNFVNKVMVDLEDQTDEVDNKKQRKEKEYNQIKEDMTNLYKVFRYKRLLDYAEPLGYSNPSELSRKGGREILKELMKQDYDANNGKTL